MKPISIVIPVLNETENVEALHQEIVSACTQAGLAPEIIFVDDGSTDGTPAALKQLAPVTAILFRKNFGQTAAMDAGIKAASQALIVTMDGDRQNDPADIPRLITHLEKEELDVVSGWRKERRDPFLKRFVSRGANCLRKILVHDGIHDSGCSLKVYRRECFQSISLYGEMHRFIPALLKIKGFRVGELTVNHRARVAGPTKYSWTRMVKGLIDMISVWFWNKYAVRPLHLLGGIGMVMGTLGVGCVGVTAFEYFRGQDLSDTVWPLLSMFFLFTGLQMFISGLIADMLSKSYFEQTKDVPYDVKATWSNS